MSPKIIQCEQGSPEWHAAKCGILSASRFADAMAGGEGKVRTKLMYVLASERITGMPEESFKNAYMEAGNADESYARELYKERTGEEVEQVGFIVNGSFGYSPDGVITMKKGLLELKRRIGSVQIETLMADKPPSSVKAQVQGGLWVSESDWIDYGSFSSGLPPFIRRVGRDETYITEMAEKLQQFEHELQALVKKIAGMF